MAIKKVLVAVDEGVWSELRSRAVRHRHAVAMEVDRALRSYLSTSTAGSTFAEAMTTPDAPNERIQRVAVNPLTAHHVTPRTKTVITEIQDPTEEPLCGRCGHRRGVHTKFGCQGACRCAGFTER